MYEEIKKLLTAFGDVRVQKNLFLKAERQTAPCFEPNGGGFLGGGCRVSYEQGRGLDRNRKPIDLQGIERKTHIVPIRSGAKDVGRLNFAGDQSVTRNEGCSLHNHWIIYKSLERLLGSVVGNQSGFESDRQQGTSGNEIRALKGRSRLIRLGRGIDATAFSSAACFRWNCSRAALGGAFHGDVGSRTRTRGCK